MWYSTVRADRYSLPAISRLVSPWLTSSATSRSRRLSAIIEVCAPARVDASSPVLLGGRRSASQAGAHRDGVASECQVDQCLAVVYAEPYDLDMGEARARSPRPCTLGSGRPRAGATGDDGLPSKVALPPGTVAGGERASLRFAADRTKT